MNIFPKNTYEARLNCSASEFEDYIEQSTTHPYLNLVKAKSFYWGYAKSGVIKIRKCEPYWQFLSPVFVGEYKAMDGMISVSGNFQMNTIEKVSAIFFIVICFINALLGNDNHERILYTLLGLAAVVSIPLGWKFKQKVIADMKAMIGSLDGKN